MKASHGLVIATGFLFGLVTSACGARDARETCEEYLDALAACPNVEVSPGAVSCREARGRDRDYFECLLSWAEEGCQATELLECMPG